MDAGTDRVASSPIETTWLDIDGLKLRCLKSGSRGPAVVLLHGGGIDAADLSWRHVLPALSASCRVHAFDWPGFGHSDPRPAHWRNQDCVTLVGRVLDALHLPRAIVIGMSMGGQLALGFALDSPERVERLVLVGPAGLNSVLPGGVLSYLVVHTPGLNRWLARMTMRNRNVLTRFMKMNMPGHPEQVTPEFVESTLAYAAKIDYGAAFRRFQEEEVRWLKWRTDYRDRLSSLAMPTLLVNGEQDKLVRAAWAEAAHRKIPNSQLFIVPGCGHVVQLECPAEFTRRVEEFCLTQ